MNAVSPELAGWISSRVADVPGQQAVVLFGGTGRMPRKLKAQGRQVAVHDVCRSHHLFQRALLLDGPAALGPDLLADCLRIDKRPPIVDRFAAWAGDVFTPEETAWLGIWHHRILESGLEPRLEALGSVAVLRTMAYWLEWNRNELGYKPLPPPAVFRHYADEINRSVARSGKVHEARLIEAGNAPRARGCDLLYCYVPPAEGMKAMDRRLAFWERWVLGDPAAPLPFDRPGELGGSLASEEDRVAALVRVLETMVDIPTWSLAFCGNGEPIAAAVERFRPLAARYEMTVPYPRGPESIIIKEGLIVAGRAA